MGANMIKNKARFAWLFIPLMIYLALMTALFFERTGVSYKIAGSHLTFLEPSVKPLASGYTDPPAETLVLYDSIYVSERGIDQAVVSALDSMRVKYDQVDINGAAPQQFSKYQTVVLAFHYLDRFNQLNELVDWVESGGRVFIAAFPGVIQSNSSIYRRIGIRSFEDQDIQVTGVTFVTDLLPGSKGLTLEGADNFISSNSYPVQLEDDARLHLTSADDYHLPLLWEKDYGKGRFVVVNTDQLANRVNRGIVGAAYGLLEDVSVYPVINSSVLFIDDFPAPIPDGENEVITQEFHRSVRSFMRDVWWPDMAKLGDKYEVKYTGLLIESYNDAVVPPFVSDISTEDQRYMGQMLLWRGGEIGLHGYNHVPLCQKKDNINQQFKYPVWPSEESGQKAEEELNRFGQFLFPGYHFTVYVPPSNILGPEARQWLPKALPDLKAISSLALEEEDSGTYMQNFDESVDGIIEFPRIVSGYQLYESEQLALINELGLHYVNSYFIHPDDILDPVRRDGRTWATMRSQLESEFQWIKDIAPGLRNMTASEAAKATERYSRLKVNTALDDDQYTIHLGNFYDEAFLMLKTYWEPVSISGGKITRVTSGSYLIQANQPDIKIQLRK